MIVGARSLFKECANERQDPQRERGGARRNRIGAWINSSCGRSRGRGIARQKTRKPLVFRGADPEQGAINLVGFVSQRDGAFLRIVNAAGAVVATKEFREDLLATSPMREG